MGGGGEGGLLWVSKKPTGAVLGGGDQSQLWSIGVVIIGKDEPICVCVRKIFRQIKRSFLQKKKPPFHLMQRFKGPVCHFSLVTISTPLSQLPPPFFQTKLLSCIDSFIREVIRITKM